MTAREPTGVLGARFFQEPPTLGNAYDDDVFLRQLLQRYVGDAGAHAEIVSDLRRFGERVVGDVLEMARNASQNEPRLVQFTPWGKRLDQIQTSEGWRALHDVAAKEGLVAIGYERRHSEFSRLHQFAKLYMFHPSSAVYTCPLAMTDGAARLLELNAGTPAQREALRRLTSRDPAQFWTSGQWMTERTGGSDVSRSETSAVPEGAGAAHRLYGFKWFTSATDANMSLALARVVDNSTLKGVDGSRGLSLFFIPMRRPDGALNGIRIERFKSKLGTRAMPTAEMHLEGTLAERVGDTGRGVATIAAMLNITRLYNSACSAGSLRRMVAYVRSFANVRVAFGKLVRQHPLHIETLAALETEARASTALVFDIVHKMGRVECKTASSRDADIVRLMTPVVKLYTGKRCLACISEALEGMGGAGYIEDNPFAEILRDAQVLTIWEGTTNILSLDVLRALSKGDLLAAYVAEVEAQMRGADGQPPLAAACAAVRAACASLVAFARGKRSSAVAETAARHFAMSLARTYAAALLVAHAAALPSDEPAATCVQRYAVQQRLYGMLDEASVSPARSEALVYARM